MFPNVLEPQFKKMNNQHHHTLSMKIYTYPRYIDEFNHLYYTFMAVFMAYIYQDFFLSIFSIYLMPFYNTSNVYFKVYMEFSKLLFTTLSYALIIFFSTIYHTLPFLFIIFSSQLPQIKILSKMEGAVLLLFFEKV